MTEQVLVIFDCDGVLVDTEALANREMARWITRAGVPTSYEQSRRRFVGMSMTSLRETILSEDGIDIGADFAERWRAALPSILGDGVQPIAGVADTIKTLRQAGYAICVASSGTVGKMHMTLGSAGLLNMLEPVLFSSTMVERGKPAPDLFLHAAATMGFAPEACAVIEDSPLGACAAKAAGMDCFGYAGDPLTDADGLSRQGATVFTTMADLPGLIAARGNGQA